MLILLPPYVVGVWLLFFAGMNGSDGMGMLAAVLIGAGLSVVVQITWLRGRLRPGGALAWNMLSLAGLGLLFGLVGRGEGTVGAVLGVGAGLLANAASMWLGDLTQFRQRPRVFLSYRRSDSERVTRAVYDALVARYGPHQVFLDAHSLVPGRDYRTELPRVVRRCNVVLVMIGPSWLEARDNGGRRRLDQPDDYVRLEIETALEAQRTVVPVLVDGADRPRPDDLPESLAALPYRQGARLRPEADLPDDVAVLVDQFEKELKHHPRDSLALLPSVRRWQRRLVIGTVLVLLLAPLGWGLTDGLTRWSRMVNDAALSPDGTRLVTTHGQGANVTSSVRMWDVTTGRLIGARDFPAGRDAPVWTVVWSPDGRRLATGHSSGELRIWDADRLEPGPPVPGHQGPLDEISWSADSELVATGDGVGTVRVWQADTGALLHQVVRALGDFRIKTVAWSPRALRLAVAGGPTLLVLDLDGPRLHESYRYQHTKDFSGLEWNPAGTRLVTATYHSVDADKSPNLHVYELGDRTMTEVSDTSGEVADPQWAPEGESLAWFEMNDFTVRIWNADTRALEQVLSASYTYDANVRWAPGGTALASAPKSHLLVWARNGLRRADLTDHVEDAEVVGWTRDGQVVTVRGTEVRVWDVDHGRTDAVCEMSLWEGLRHY
ncbi:toll/interleukin-1 receptor domain-containing protein [Micromonospora sp. NPDC023888]|uniref:toll/interleukin-1 receptor domain-containing protein n=1 Tax=Micromonospora sp. NPDC023888 TaxID=3155607 RepID=UPI003405BD46